QRARAARLLRRPARRLQGAAADRHPRRDPQGRDRQAAADRPRRQARPRDMKLCIFGAGAIGGYLAAKLAASEKTELSVVARGPHLDAIRTNGLTLIEGGEE